MNKKYGLYLNNQLMNTYDDPREALSDAMFAQEESELFHEVREIKESEM